MLKHIADNSNETSFSHKMRKMRFAHFMSLLNKMDRPISILDVGGTQEYWSKMGFNNPDIQITLLNLKEQHVTGESFKSVAGDATNMKEFSNKSFDIVFSNSVIEHLFTRSQQLKMANEVTRVGKFYYIQTPNFFFPIEPHFLFPGFQFLPFSLRVFMINKFSLGHIPRKKLKNDAITQINEIKLLATTDMKELFPDATIWKEKLFGMTKSIVAHNFTT
jgi:ubiquinone/menaquinone biosynthesis C-methylase UbiE